MTLTIELSADVERRLRERAARNGQTAEDYVRSVLARELTNGGPPDTGTTGKTFDQIFARFEQAVAQSGMTDEEFDTLLEGEIRAARRDRRAGP
jgi:Antitoxin FitA-like, ribbon-helix-helix